MKIYNSNPDGNQASELSPVIYFGLSIKQLNEESLRIVNIDSPIQVLLVHLDILLYLSKKYPAVASRNIKKQETIKWKKSFYNWYERCNSKIPKKFREGIKESADKLFAELEPLGTTWIG